MRSTLTFMFAFASCLLATSCSPPPNANVPHASTRKLSLFAPKSTVSAGLFEHTAKRGDGSEVRFVSNRQDLLRGPARPAIVVVDGSGCGSVVTRAEDGSIEPHFLSAVLQAVGDQYTVVALEKRGVKLFDAIDTGDSACSREYLLHATFDDRVAEQKALLASLADLPAVDRSRVVIVGHSEGALVAAGAGDAPEVTHIGFLAGVGPSQAFDFALMFRERMQGHDPAEVEATVTDVMNKVRAIESDPDSIEHFIWGHAYRRWSSFIRRAAADDLVRAAAPVFIAHGSEDVAARIASTDFTEVELIRRGKKNFVVKRYPGLNHRFAACPKAQSEHCESAPDHAPEVMSDFLRWVESASVARQFAPVARSNL